MGIGTTHESALHRELKHMFSAYTGKTEIDIDGFVCDGSKDDGTVFEVQLGSFGPLKRKAEIICEKRRLVILHPVIHTKEIYTFDEHQNLMSRRKSPRKGSEWDVFKALIYAPRLPLIKNISIELVHVDITETR
ncbi:MAG: hypothetical protein LBC72_05910, partial [Spirochaetaceae bacterium]|nr:hypothetical protein [Spirochaetaceae bacterium]